MSGLSAVSAAIDEYMEKNQTLIKNAASRNEKARRAWLEQQQESHTIEVESWLLAIELHQHQKQLEFEAAAKAAKRKK